jgi:replication initiation and membrane attachment protein DnaB
MGRTISKSFYLKDEFITEIALDVKRQEILLAETAVKKYCRKNNSQKNSKNFAMK